jgi:hypothetical protein
MCRDAGSGLESMLGPEDMLSRPDAAVAGEFVGPGLESMPHAKSCLAAVLLGHTP